MTEKPTHSDGNVDVQIVWSRIKDAEGGHQIEADYYGSFTVTSINAGRVFSNVNVISKRKGVFRILQPR